MQVAGIRIDKAGTKFPEDGFSVDVMGDHYLLTFAVVNVGCRLKRYEDFLVGHARNMLFPENDIKKKDISFCEVPRKAFLFTIKVGLNGEIERFSPSKGTFKIIESIDFNSSENHPVIVKAKECMDAIAQRGKHPFITKSNSLPQLTQNMSLFVSLELYSYMVKKVGISAIYTGVTSGNPSKESETYRPDAGRLLLINNSYGVRIINGEGILVNTKYTRGFVYNESDVSLGNYTMPIASPFRSDDALLNQIILGQYIDGVEPGIQENIQMKLLGPSLECRERYMSITSKEYEFKYNISARKSGIELKGKVLKSFVSILIDYNLISKQIEGMSEAPYSNIEDQVTISAYYIAQNIALPENISSWLKSICSAGGGTLNTFMHNLLGLPFASTFNAGGVISFEINGRLFEVDDCIGYKARLLGKMIDGVSREAAELPSSYQAKISLLERLLEDPEVRKHISQIGI